VADKIEAKLVADDGAKYLALLRVGEAAPQYQKNGLVTPRAMSPKEVAVALELGAPPTKKDN